MKIEINSIENNRVQFLYFLLIWLAYRFWANTLMSQIGSASIICPEIDNTFWLFHLLQIPTSLASSPILSTLFDLSLFMLIVSSIFISKIWMNILLSILLIVYHIVFSTFACHHFHSLVGIIFVSFIFWSDKYETRFLSLKAVRYYFLFIFLSAAVWKISRGQIFDINNLSDILTAQHFQWMSDFPNSLKTTLYQFLIDHKLFSQSLFVLVTIIEFSFLIGFFTYKADNVLLIFFITFLVFNYIVMGIFSFELLPFIFVLNPMLKKP